MYGESGSKPKSVSAFIGSSPRVRGIQIRAVAESNWNRFIPASAGNTGAPSSSPRARPVHPRECGEYAFLTSRTPVLFGSSPRVRGIRADLYFLHTPGRFIPASAGNTSWCLPPRSRWPVHPRECGEYDTIAEYGVANNGSSPRVRGIREVNAGKSAYLRFIPASAGNTSGPAPSLGRWPVHPRECGEYSVPVGNSVVAGGSSPRVRGILRFQHVLDAVDRFIPASAGNTLPVTQ
jgi:hypothetical protein